MRVQIPFIKFAAALALMTLMSLSSCITDPPEEERVISVGEPVPEFTVTLGNGEEWSSRDSGGRTSVIIFFNTGCDDCRRELPGLDEEYREKGDRMRFVCIAREEDASDIAAWWRDNGLTMPWSAQSDRRIYGMFANTGIPRIFIVGPDSRIAASFGPGQNFEF